MFDTTTSERTAGLRTARRRASIGAAISTIDASYSTEYRGGGSTSTQSAQGALQTVSESEEEKIAQKSWEIKERQRDAFHGDVLYWLRK